MPSDCPDYINLALLAFSEDEIDSLYAAVGASKEFLGIGFTGPGGVFTKFSDPKKALALRILEDNYFEWVAPEPELLEMLQKMGLNPGMLV